MNPFDFVPFSKKAPILKSLQDWLLIDDELVSGFIRMQIKAMTPVHIVGIQKSSSSSKTEYSKYYRHRNIPMIPASSIRGMLRSFLESACNCWASQMTPFYKKEKRKHTIGFQATDSFEQLKANKEQESVNLDIPQSLPKQFQVPEKADKIDIASFLFGFVPQKEGPAIKGRVAIEDIIIDQNDISLNVNQYLVPDIEDSAFMGGAHPSASSWWYQFPLKIQMNNNNMPQFIGAGYRGRKFYYHQNPNSCVKWYTNPTNWPIDSERKLYTFPLECLKKDAVSNEFRIYFEELPKVFLYLIVFALNPGKHLRHKIGYGKAYGYGSIEINILNISIRGHALNEKNTVDVFEVFQNNLESIKNKMTNDKSILNYLDLSSLESLAKILWWDENSSQIFTYPRFNAGYQVTNKVLDRLKELNVPDEICTEFKKLVDEDVCVRKTFQLKLPTYLNNEQYKAEKNKAIEQAKVVDAEFLPAVREKDLRDILDPANFTQLRNTRNLLMESDEKAKQIARKLAQKKIRTALHFDVFREMSNNFTDIRKRTMIDAL